VTNRWVDAPVPCLDPECAERGGMAEPESDGDLHYYACTICGYEGGYEQAVPAEGNCSLGIPEKVRRAASIPLSQEQQPVFLGAAIGRRPQ